MKLRPINDCVLLEPEEFVPYNEYKGFKKIIVPDKFSHGPEDRNWWGKVLEVGKDCNGVVKKGDRVCWGKFASEKFEFGKKTFMLVREYDILLVVDER